MSRLQEELDEVAFEIERLLDRIRTRITPREHRDLTGAVEHLKLLVRVTEPKRVLPSEPEEPPTDLDA